MNLRIERVPLVGSSLVDDYLAGRGGAGEFYAGDPYDLAEYRKRAVETAARFATAERRAVGEILRPSSERAAHRLARFVAEGGAVVTTGQQAGLFGGPLYTLYKALTAVRLAEVMEGELGMVVLPVFWVASEDHDWEEVNHTWVPDFRGGIRRIEVERAGAVDTPIFRMPVPANVETALGQIIQVVGTKSATDDVLTWVEDAYVDAADYGAAFRRLLEVLLEPFDILTVDAADAALKQRSVPVLERAIAAQRDTAAAVREQTDALRAVGYGAQVAILSEAANVFREGELGRRRLERVAGGWRSPGTRRTIADEELREELAADPARFTPNVLLRPVVESAVLPVLAYVGGPGEIAYFAQLGALFQVHGVPPPLVYPRASFVLIREELDSHLARLGLTLADLEFPAHELAERHARRQLPADAAAALHLLRASLTERYDEVIAAGAALDPTLRLALAASRDRALLEAARAERKIVRAVKRREADALQMLDDLLAELRPLGEPQDRVLNALPYLARFGPDLLGEIAARIEIPLHRKAAAS